MASFGLSLTGQTGQPERKRVKYAKRVESQQKCIQIYKTLKIALLQNLDYYCNMIIFLNIFITFIIY